MWSADGKRKSAYFPSLTALEAKLRELKEAKSKGDIGILPSRDEVLVWRAFRAGAHGIDPMQILAEWRTYREKEGRPLCTVTVAEAVEQFLAKQRARMSVGTIGADTLRQRTRKLTLFTGTFGEYLLDEVTAEDIEEWLDDLEHLNSPETFNDYRKRIAELFAAYSEYVRKNPAKAIERRRTLGSTVKVMPVDDVAKVLEYTRDHQPHALVRMAAEVFTGLRFTSAARLQKEHVNFSTGFLDIPAKIMKRRRPHSFEPPPAFWLWANIGKSFERGWSMSLTDYMHAKSAIFTNAKVVHPHNGIRHSFCSYHVAAFKNPGSTALILAHRSQEMLWSTYRGKASEADGKRYFDLRP